MRIARIAALFVLGTGAWLPAATAAEPAGATTTRFYWSVSAGNFDGAERVGRLENGSSGAVLGFGFGHRITSYLAGEAEVGVAGQTYDLPGYDGEGEPTIGLYPLTYSLKLSRPSGRVRPFVRLGAGFFKAYMEVVFGPSDTADVDDGSGLLTYWGAGLDVVLGKRSSIGLEYREMDAEADFRGADGVDLGGSSLLVTFRMDFGRPLGQRSSPP